MRTELLSDTEIGEITATRCEWRVENSTLKAEFTFGSFRSAIAFITLVAFEAEAVNHHPVIFNEFKSVCIVLTTHDAGGRITNLDRNLAIYVSESAYQLGGA